MVPKLKALILDGKWFDKSWLDHECKKKMITKKAFEGKTGCLQKTFTGEMRAFTKKCKG